MLTLAPYANTFALRHGSTVLAVGTRGELNTVKTFLEPPRRLSGSVAVQPNQSVAIAQHSHTRSNVIPFPLHRVRVARLAAISA